mgnify:CR=1 FL=1
MEGIRGLQKNMLVKEPSKGSTTALVTEKVSATRVSAVRWVESRYTLHRLNKDREKQQLGNLGHMKVRDAGKE